MLTKTAKLKSVLLQKEQNVISINLENTIN